MMNVINTDTSTIILCQGLKRETNKASDIEEEHEHQFFSYQNIDYWIDKFAGLSNDYKAFLAEKEVVDCLKELLTKDHPCVQTALHYQPNGWKNNGADNFLTVKMKGNPAGTIEVKNFNWGTKLHSGNVNENYFDKRKHCIIHGQKQDIRSEVIILFGGYSTTDVQDRFLKEGVFLIHVFEPILPKAWLSEEGIKEQRSKIRRAVKEAYNLTISRLKISRPFSLFKLTYRLFKIARTGVRALRYGPLTYTFFDTATIAEEGSEEEGGEDLQGRGGVRKEFQARDGSNSDTDVQVGKDDVVVDDVHLMEKENCGMGIQSWPSYGNNHSHDPVCRYYLATRLPVLPPKEDTDPPDSIFSSHHFMPMTQKTLSLSSLSSSFLNNNDTTINNNKSHRDYPPPLHQYRFKASFSRIGKVFKRLFDDCIRLSTYYASKKSSMSSSLQLRQKFLFFKTQVIFYS